MFCRRQLAPPAPLPSATAHVESDCGVVSFTPPTTGDYYVYYLPYVQSGHCAGTHFHWFNCSDKTNTAANPCVIDEHGSSRRLGLMRR